jgi:hypothetical protein
MYDSYRKFRSCGYSGYVGRWFTRIVYPVLIASILLLLGLIPGILFTSWGRHTQKCPDGGMTRD